MNKEEQKAYNKGYHAGLHEGVIMGVTGVKEAIGGSIRKLVTGVCEEFTRKTLNNLHKGKFAVEFNRPTEGK